MGFRVTDIDPGIFYAHTPSGILVLTIHVDDCILTGTSPSAIAEYKSKIHALYSITDLGPIHWLLGIQVTCDHAARTISLSQTSYVDTILHRFSLSDAWSYNCPMVPGALLTKDHTPKNPQEETQMKKTPYCEAIGSLMYLAVATCPNISFAVSTLSQFLTNPGVAHWEAVKRVFQYLISTKDTSLTFGADHPTLLGYTDANGGTQAHSRAISGYVFLLDGRAISWSSHKQELVTLSTTEAEYVAAMNAAKELIWLQCLIC